MRCRLSSLWGRYGRSLFAHTSYQLAARVYTAGSQLVAYALVGALGSDSLVATFALSMAAAGLVATAVDFGSGLWVVRHAARGIPLPRLAIVRAAAMLVSAVALLVAATVGLVPWVMAPLILVVGVVIGCSNFWRGVLWARLHHEREAVAAVIQATVLVATIGLAMAQRLDWPVAPLAAAAIAYGVGYLMRRVMSYAMVQSAESFVGLRQWIREAYSYAGQALVVTAQTQVDLLLLGGLWGGPTAGVAAYGLAMRFYYAIGMPFEALGTAIMPRVAVEKRIWWTRILKVAVATACLAVVAMLLLTSAGQVFGLSASASAYLETVGIILLLALPFRFAAYVLGAVVTGIGRQSARFTASAVGLTTMLVLDLLLIPSKGPYGAAIALVCADLALGVGYSLAARRSLSLAR